MDTTRVKYTINLETRWKIKIETLTWKRLTTKYYIIDGAFTDQIISDSRTLKIKEEKEWKTEKVPKICKRVDDSWGMKRYIIVGSIAWKERYLEYEWNGHEFDKKRKQPLSGFINMV